MTQAGCNSNLEFDSVNLPPILHTYDPEERLLQAIEAKNYPGAYAALRALPAPLSGDAARECLTEALDCTPALFSAVLERCAPRELIGSASWRAEDGGPLYAARGSILLLAAAMNKPKHMRCLLERGWDANGASYAVAQALCETGFTLSGYLPASGGLGGSYIRFDERPLPDACRDVGRGPGYMESCTPLAAALRCGSEDAVRLLMEQPGIRTLASSAVCRAAVRALHDPSGTRQRCLRLVFPALAPVPDAELPDALLRGYPLELAAAAECGTPEEFALRLSGPACTERQLRDALVVLADGCAGDEAAKLEILLAHKPSLAQEIRNCALKLCLDNPAAGARNGTLELWKRLCGKRRDISRNAGSWLAILRNPAALRGVLRELGAGGTLCCAAESRWLLGLTSAESIRAMLEYVRFYRTVPEGLGISTMRLLGQNELRLFRAAVKRGALDSEPRDELLACAAQLHLSPVLRAAILSLPPAAAPDAEEPAVPCRGGVVWQSANARSDAAERGARLRALWEKPLTPDECRNRLRAADPLCQTRQSALLINRDGTLPVSEDGLVFYSLCTAACCGRNPALLRVLLEDAAEYEGQFSLCALSWSGSVGSLTGSPLCCAAAAGRVEQVQLLLECGADPNELDIPQRSVFCTNAAAGERRQVVSPLYMARLLGHAETAELLAAHGAEEFPPPPRERNQTQSTTQAERFSTPLTI